MYLITYTIPGIIECIQRNKRTVLYTTRVFSWAIYQSEFPSNHPKSSNVKKPDTEVTRKLTKYIKQAPL